MKLFRRFLIALSLLFILRLYLGGYDELVTLQLRQILQQQRVPCEISSVHIAPLLRPQIAELRCEIPNSNRLIALQNVELSLSFLSLFQLKPGLTASWTGSKGQFAVQLSRSILSGASQLNISIDGLALGSLPQNGPLQILGNLSARAEVHLEKSGEPVGSGRFEVQDFGVGPSGAGFRLLPQIGGGELTGKLELQGAQFAARPIDLSSPFGEMSAEIDGTIEGGSSASYKGKGEIHLTPDGVKKIGGFLALAARSQNVEKPSDEWTFSLNGRTGTQPVFSLQESAGK